MHEDIVRICQQVPEDEPFYIEMAGISYCDGSYRIDRRSAFIYVFEYVLKGQGTVCLHDETFQPIQGDVYILPAGSHHLYYADPADPWEKIWFNVGGPLIDHLLQAYKISHIHHFRQFHGLQENNPLHEAFMRFLTVARSTMKPAHEIHEKAALILHEIISLLQDSPLLAEPERNPVAVQLKEYLDSRIMLTASLEQMSRHIHKSTSQTIRLFRQAYGTTPYQYLMRRKIETACLILNNTSLPIQEIALRLHFTDEHYFSNYFKAMVGKSPDHYRRGTLSSRMTDNDGRPDAKARCRGSGKARIPGE